MEHITDEIYREIAVRLIEAIGRAEFFNGTVSARIGGSDIELRATLIIRRIPAIDPTDLSGAVTKISDIIPVWWECHTYRIDGEEINDFSWCELKCFMQ